MSLRTIDIKRDTERLYNYLVAFVGDNGYPPRRCDIGDDLGISEYQLDRALLRLRGARRICEGSTLPTVYSDPLPPAA
jgi:hypothetical protein